MKRPGTCCRERASLDRTLGQQAKLEVKSSEEAAALTQADGSSRDASKVGVLVFKFKRTPVTPTEAIRLRSVSFDPVLLMCCA